jgi:hypothetical protein
MENKSLWMVSHISAFLGEGVSTTTDNYFCWITDNGSIEMDVYSKEVKFVDCTMDLKTQFAIQGLALSNGFVCGDYFTN